MDENKVAFIICANNQIYYDECCYYISRLKRPEEFKCDVVGIWDAPSMCAGYNAGMNSSDAKYKVYLHQDVFIREPDFILHLLKRFRQDTGIGMIGMMGGDGMPKTGVTYLAWNAGAVDCYDPDMAYRFYCTKNQTKDCTVEAVDGLLIATQYDITWREDLFKHFDFYDVAQSFEMRKAGYKIVVPYQEIPWVIHDSGFVKLVNYDEARKICLKEYPQYLYAEGGTEFVYDREWDELCHLLAGQVKKLITENNWEQVEELLNTYRKTDRKSSEIETLGILYDIYEREKNKNIMQGFFENCKDYDAIYNKYMSVRFLLKRMETGMEPMAYRELTEAILEEQISYEVLEVMVIHSVINKKSVVEQLFKLYENAGMYRQSIACEKLYQIVKEYPIPVTYSKIEVI